MTVTDRDVLTLLERMSVEARTLFELLPPRLQQAYVEFWASRPDFHGAHRDTLPAFIAGVMASLR